jgi:hypothetical protein
MRLTSRDPIAVAATNAIHAGDLPALMRLLEDHPGLASARIEDHMCPETSRSLLHVATDWPGHFPNVGSTITALAKAGADVNARFVGQHTETPLHWAASSDDVAAIDALLAAGADIEAPGAVIAGGSPLADARGFGQWNAARLLVERGAHATLNDAATLGLLDRLMACFPTSAEETPTPDQITRAFWGACHGGQLEAARFLLDRGADINWVGHGGWTPLDVARQPSAEALAGIPHVQELLRWLTSRGARSAASLR